LWTGAQRAAMTRRPAIAVRARYAVATGPLRVGARAIARLVGAMLLACLLAHCAVVSVRQDARYNADARTADALSAATVQALGDIGVEPDSCRQDAARCSDLLAQSQQLSRARQLAARADLAHARAYAMEAGKAGNDAVIAAYLEAARLAYAGLLHGVVAPTQDDEGRKAALQRYDDAVERVAMRLFDRPEKIAKDAPPPRVGQRWDVAGWSLTLDRIELHLPDGSSRVDAIVPTSHLRIEGVRHEYVRHGLGATLVAVATPEESQDDALARGIGYMSATLVIAFPGASVDDVLATRQASLQVIDPYRTNTIQLHGLDVAVAANFTAPYALWLDRSGFTRQAVAGVFGRQRAIQTARLFMMQPYEPSRRTIVMLHGLASSPEGWANLANEVLGDDTLRDRYQVWQVYYPTNLPIAENRKEIAGFLASVRARLDPWRNAPASNEVVLIGHSMGGVLARLLVIDSGDRVWETLFDAPVGSAERQRLAALEPYLVFKPERGVTRAIFVASPHAGTPTAGRWFGRMVAGLVRLPATLVTHVQSMADLVASDQPEFAKLMRSTNAITSLDASSPYLKATSALDIAPGVTYHSIIARKKPKVPLEQSSDGFVPYASAHLPGAASELVVTSGHSVQESPEAIMEIRRILHTHLNEIDAQAATRKAVAGAANK